MSQSFAVFALATADLFLNNLNLKHTLLNGRFARRKLLLKDCLKMSFLHIATHHVTDPANLCQRWFGQIKPKLTFLNYMLNAMVEGKTIYHINVNAPCPNWNMLAEI